MVTIDKRKTQFPSHCPRCWQKVSGQEWELFTATSAKGVVYTLGHHVWGSSFIDRRFWPYSWKVSSKYLFYCLFSPFSWFHKKRLNSSLLVFSLCALCHTVDAVLLLFRTCPAWSDMTVWATLDTKAIAPFLQTPILPSSWW